MKPIDFETARRLRQAGFIGYCNHAYNTLGELLHAPLDGRFISCYAPTPDLAAEWLVTQGITVWAEPVFADEAKGLWIGRCYSHHAADILSFGADTRDTVLTKAINAALDILQDHQSQ